MNVFKNYANYYDDIYTDKDYKQESDFLLSIIEKYSSISVKDILSLGCGTGTYETILAKKGFNILGIDNSKEMLNIAKEKLSAPEFIAKSTVA